MSQTVRDNLGFLLAGYHAVLSVYCTYGWTVRNPNKKSCFIPSIQHLFIQIFPLKDVSPNSAGCLRRPHGLVAPTDRWGRREHQAIRCSHQRFRGSWTDKCRHKNKTNKDKIKNKWRTNDDKWATNNVKKDQTLTQKLLWTLN